MRVRAYQARMRELKFRAWSEETKSFEYFDLYEGTECGLTNLQIWARDTQIEQYTGLKDKNGKEIYEGDIVKCGPYSGKPIVSEEGRYWLGEEPDDLFVATVRWEIEVIGNIHENIKLLEEECES